MQYIQTHTHILHLRRAEQHQPKLYEPRKLSSLIFFSSNLFASFSSELYGPSFLYSILLLFLFFFLKTESERVEKIYIYIQYVYVQHIIYIRVDVYIAGENANKNKPFAVYCEVQWELSSQTKPAGKSHFPTLISPRFLLLKKPTFIVFTKSYFMRCIMHIQELKCIDEKYSIQWLLLLL